MLLVQGINKSVVTNPIVFARNYCLVYFGYVNTFINSNNVMVKAKSL